MPGYINNYQGVYQIGINGYIVRADDPLTWEEIQAYPVLDVRPVLASSLLVFVDFTSILAYGRTGVAWRTGQISSDGLEVKEITSRYIRGLAFDAVQQREVDFLVDLETGKIVSSEVVGFIPVFCF